MSRKLTFQSLTSSIKYIHNSCWIITLVVFQLSETLTGMTCSNFSEQKATKWRQYLGILKREFMNFLSFVIFRLLFALVLNSITLAHFDTRDYTNPLMTFRLSHIRQSDGNRSCWNRLPYHNVNQCITERETFVGEH